MFIYYQAYLLISNKHIQTKMKQTIRNKLEKNDGISCHIFSRKNLSIIYYSIK